MLKSTKELKRSNKIPKLICFKLNFMLLNKKFKFLYYYIKRKKEIVEDEEEEKKIRKYPFVHHCHCRLKKF